jgi:hypothetical protein
MVGWISRLAFCVLKREVERFLSEELEIYPDTTVWIRDFGILAERITLAHYL